MASQALFHEIKFHESTKQTNASWQVCVSLIKFSRIEFISGIRKIYGPRKFLAIQ